MISSHNCFNLGMLQHADGSIMKPVQPPPRGECEVNFYSKVFDPKCEDPVLQTLRPFLPKFCGVCYPFSSPGREDSSKLCVGCQFILSCEGNMKFL